MAHLAARLLITFGVIFTSKASDNETATRLPDEASVLLLPPEGGSTAVPDASSLVLRATDEAALATSEPSTTPPEPPTSTAAVATTGGPRRAPQAPHYHLPDSRWGPFFEGGPEPHNVTARVGSTVLLDCRIGLLQDKMVTWLHHKDNSIQLLTVGKSAYSRDERITLSFRYPNNFRLEIVYVTRRDEGLYECQVATHPPKVKRTFLKVTAPELRIVDESGREVTERYYKAGSALELTCMATHVGGPSEEHPVTWRHGERTLSSGISTNTSTSTDSTISTLTVTPLVKRHSGNYTCAVGSLASATVAVHVLNGELPAAVHDGNSAPAGAVVNVAVVIVSVVLCSR